MINIEGKDRRVARTRGLLHGALASLIHEKAYDAIVVKEILARANVGRSTFYAHFRDKDELLVTGLRDMLRAGRRAAALRSDDPVERLLRFSLPVLHHIERFRDEARFAIDADRQAIVHARLRDLLTESIAEELGELGELGEPGTTVEGARARRDLLARYLASTFVLVLDWWVRGTPPLPAREADARYRELVVPTLVRLRG